MKQSTRSRKWFWTSYSPPNELTRKYDYMCYQEEICPTTGRHHWQGFTILASQSTAKQFKLAMQDDTIHLTVPDDNVEECIKYCSKEDTAVPGTFREFGTRPKGRGHRSDLDRFMDSVKKGVVPDLFDMPSIHARFPRFVDKCKMALLKPEFKKKEVQYIWGPAGSGKTRYVYDTYGYDNVYSWDSDQPWWDGYEGQSVILIDDVYPHNILHRRKFFLNLLDGYPMTVPVKGSTVPLRATTIIFTSNFEYPFEEDNAFHRRFTKVTKFGGGDGTQ